MAQSSSSAKPIATVLSRNVSFRLYVFPTQFIAFPNYSVTLLSSSMQFLCYSRLFAPFLRPSYTFQLRDWSTLFLWQSSLYDSFAILDISYPFRCLRKSSLYFSVATQRHSPTAQWKSSLCLNFSFPCPHFSVLRYSTTLKTSRLSRSCCSRVSGSLAVCSSHRDNLCIRC